MGPAVSADGGRAVGSWSRNAAEDSFRTLMLTNLKLDAKHAPKSKLKALLCESDLQVTYTQPDMKQLAEDVEKYEKAAFPLFEKSLIRRLRVMQAFMRGKRKTEVSVKSDYRGCWSWLTGKSVVSAKYPSKYRS